MIADFGVNGEGTCDDQFFQHATQIIRLHSSFSPEPTDRMMPGYTGPGRMLKKSASSVLASLRGSTRVFGNRKHWRGFSIRQDPSYGRTTTTQCGWYLLASSLAAALPWNGVSWHAGVGRVRSLAFLSILRFLKLEFQLSYFNGIVCTTEFFRSLLEWGRQNDPGRHVSRCVSCRERDP